MCLDVLSPRGQLGGNLFKAMLIGMLSGATLLSARGVSARQRRDVQRAHTQSHRNDVCVYIRCPFKVWIMIWVLYSWSQEGR